MAGQELYSRLLLSKSIDKKKKRWSPLQKHFSKDCLFFPLFPNIWNWTCKKRLEYIFFHPQTVLNSWEDILECSTHVGGAYIFFYPQRDCFVVSQPFSSARSATCFKLGSKPGWLYVSQTSYPRVIVILGDN